MPGWIMGHHIAENLGETEHTAYATWVSPSVLASNGTGTLRPMLLDSTGLTTHIHRYFCHGNPRCGALVHQLLPVPYLACVWCRSRCSPPQHTVGSRLPSVGELMCPIHYATLLQRMPKFFSGNCS